MPASEQAITPAITKSPVLRQEKPFRFKLNRPVFHPKEQRIQPEKQPKKILLHYPIGYFQHVIILNVS